MSSVLQHHFSEAARSEKVFMDEHLEIKKIQGTLLDVLPVWNYKIEKPFKKLLDEGVSLEMYYCIRILQWHGSLTMSELANIVKMPKQQMTKMVNRLVEQEFAKRIYDPSDRRIIKIELTENAQKYIDRFLTQDAECFQKLLEQMSETDRSDFMQAISTLTRILYKDS